MRIGSLLTQILQIFLFALLARLILDYIRKFSRNWRPRGAVAGVIELIYTITDKPMRFVARFIPPLRLGGVSLDLSFIVLFFGIRLLQNLLISL